MIVRLKTIGQMGHDFADSIVIFRAEQTMQDSLLTGKTKPPIMKA